MDEWLPAMVNVENWDESAMAITIGLLWNSADPTVVEDKEGKRPYKYAKANGWLDAESPLAQTAVNLLEADCHYCRRGDYYFKEILLA
ncbi:uncharacterized protein ColSpa_09776 [Colletotrichum spaethianum]|uniref:Uncharacterized protein n=1 Tax=Colletotrichum spaethianum TaxID=700344 RepID=A0AA37PC80_9PEZI|nr:uncharacterized protein ColSpa_09776 [Colletotrichum spaethianum]GKT49595.1 hypothetical protein ColSpa_09776 [Colletotrichum spaethianum]